MIDPARILGEILGDPAELMRNPVNADYLCPFINSTCVKRSHRIIGPYPVCSVHRSKLDQRLMAVCPKRFYEPDLIHDVIEHAWTGNQPSNPKIAYEVKMEKFGNVDFVIADVDVNDDVIDFVSVEVQAVDCTGTVEPAYTALLNSENLEKAPTYGINWANVRKRYIAQLITKGFYHHHWQSRLISIVQEPLYESLKDSIKFDELSVKNNPSANIVFMIYDFESSEVTDERNAQSLTLKRVVGTSHHSLMMSAIYQTPPDKSVFSARIKSRILAEGS